MRKKKSPGPRGFFSTSFPFLHLIKSWRRPLKQPSQDSSVAVFSRLRVQKSHRQGVNERRSRCGGVELSADDGFGYLLQTQKPRPLPPARLRPKGREVRRPAPVGTAICDHEPAFACDDVTLAKRRVVLDRHSGEADGVCPVTSAPVDELAPVAKCVWQICIGRAVFGGGDFNIAAIDKFGFACRAKSVARGSAAFPVRSGNRKIAAIAAADAPTLTAAVSGARSLGFVRRKSRVSKWRKDLGRRRRRPPAECAEQPGQEILGLRRHRKGRRR